MIRSPAAAAGGYPAEVPAAERLYHRRMRPLPLAVLAGRARLHTDDDPWVELVAPHWLHRSTGAANQRLIDDVREGLGPR